MAFNPDYYSSSARKLETVEPKRKIRRRVVKKTKPANKIDVKKVIVTVSVFMMFMVIAYRYNIINEKNMKALTLKTELNRVESALATTSVNISQSTNLTEIESYAKQKLGMQKPDKNQIIYVDTSKDASVVKEENSDFFESVINKIKEIFN